ncbi:response regulator [Spirosoma sp. KCTC 42546]|uniref:response regulator n=1 Tax=Spirosoma sp. KCTC 42546 TaxID=2520506 RepID=UPI00115AD949|nr:response regulator [Spirosoma sp. KCTC 42546]QDK81583.1 response regulator [Spirosoma sp. KCTC 42546]
MPTTFTILLVDDDPEIADILTRVSIKSFPEARFIHVRHFADAVKYLDNLNGLGPNVVLLDIHLQTEPSGFEFLTLMRNHPIGCLVPIIILTATSTKTLALEAYNRGATAFTVKPFTYHDWKTYVDQLRLYWFETATIPRLYFR